MSDDASRLRRLRRMKLGATGLLAAAAIGFLITFWVTAHPPYPGWVPWVRDACEAGTVGGLADWFAVTALFRRPLGLPIPHTAIIPTRKDEIGQSLADFVAENFLTPETVRERIADADLVGRGARWASRPEHLRSLVEAAAPVAREAIAVLTPEELLAVVDGPVTDLVTRTPVAATLGRSLARIVADDGHQVLVDRWLRGAYAYLMANEMRVVTLVRENMPSWTPEFVDRGIGDWVFRRVTETVLAAASDRRHAVRLGIDNYLAEIATRLEHDPDLANDVDRIVADAWASPAARAWRRQASIAARDALVEVVGDPQSALWRWVVEGIATWAGTVLTDPATRDRVDGAVDRLVIAVTDRRTELGALISRTVERWDAADTSRKVEVAVGRDLQYIRINGTVVGALAGLVLHALTLALGG